MRKVSMGALLALAVAGVMPGGAFAQGFGGAVGVAGGEVLVAHPDYGDRSGGSVYVYTGGGGEWMETGSLMSPDASAGDGFGYSLAVSGTHLLVTALNPRSPEGGAKSVYAFTRTATGWTSAGKIMPDGLPEEILLGAVALSGDLAAVAAAMPRAQGVPPVPGMVLVFRNANGSWVQEAILESPRSDEMTGFGGSLALSGGMLVVGAPAADSASGAAYIYEGGSGGWTMTTELTIDDGPGAFLGLAAQVLGDRVLVSAGDPRRQPGQIISFTREDDGWTESGRLRAFDGAPGNQFGTSMTSDGSTLWVGAPGADGRRGAIYEFTMGDGGWSGASKVGGRPEAGTWMGTMVAYGDGVLVSGMPQDDNGLGTATILDRSAAGWSEGYAVFKDVEGIPPVLGGQVDCADGEATVFGCGDVDLVAYMPVSDLGGERGTRVNDVWGWTDPETNHDYAIVGRRDGTSFVDVTDPPNPVLVGNLPKPEWAPTSIWRDMKVYKDHVFVVSDGSPEHGMQVFDLTRLREFSGTPLTFTHDVHYDRLSAVHNIVINEETGFAYAVGAGGGGETCGGGLHMIDIRDPRNPTFAGCFADDRTGRSNTGYTHDAQCVVYRGPDEEHAGKEICLGANESHLSIADVSDKQNPVALSVIDYPNVGYSHQGWLTEDHAHFFMNDELDEVGRLVPSTRTLIWDISDLDDPILVKQHFSENTASDHNLYIRGNLMYQSNYNSGLRILDVSDVENPRDVAFFDTVPGADSPSMNGSWSNYPFFKSGIIIVTSGGEGLFVVRHRARMPIS